jgi:hypothetical protein
MTDPTPNNAPVPVPLSPAAQAVLDAAFDTDFEIDFANLDATWEASINKIVVATLRAVADQVVPAGGSRKNNEIRAELLAIAPELEGHQ